jgi:succinyl-CoA synthetase beta subunit
LPAGKARFLDEFESLKLLAGAGVAVVEHRLCRSEAEARAAFRALGPKVVVKACSASVPHKTEQGLVKLGVQEEDAVAAIFRDFKARLPPEDGVLVARHAAGRRELALGARLDPAFGPVVLVGDGGIYLEALKDFRLLLPPFGEEDVLAALGDLRMAPLLRGQRGAPPLDVEAFARMAVIVGSAMLAADGRIASVDVNPVMLFEDGRGALAVDALVERAAGA